MSGKTVRLSMLCKKYLNKIAENRECVLYEKREYLKEKAFEYLYGKPEFKGLSVALVFGVSYSRIISDAYHNALKYSQEELKAKIIEIQSRDEKIEEDVGNLALRLNLSDEVENGIDKLCNELRPVEMKRNYRFSYIIMILLIISYEDDYFNEGEA